MMDSEEIRSSIMLAKVSYYYLPVLLELYKHVGSAKEIVSQYKNLKDVAPNIPQRVLEMLAEHDRLQEMADREMEWMQRNGVEALCLNDVKYPRRLTETCDPPLVLFYKGTANIDAPHTINIVGTRHITTYGADMVRRLVNDMAQLVPDALIVSGLAYGVDIRAHREALDRGMNTVAVLAHGLDTIYPQYHRDTANRMLRQGGLITEFLTHTNPDKMNFVRRNRITAGLCDATVLVESAAKGGGLITTRIARDYSRDVFAVPGPVGAPYSEGCNNLIRDCCAQLITSAEDIVNALGWQKGKMVAKARQQGIERQLFPELNAEEQAIVNCLTAKNDLPANIICVKTMIPVGKVSALLLDLEMKGIVKLMAGGIYHLLK